MADPATQFQQTLLAGIEAVKRDHHYTPTYYTRMVQEHGGVEAARRLLRSPDPASGLTRLWELGALQYSAEALVLRPEYAALFTAEERAQARQILAALHYHAPWDAAAPDPAAPTPARPEPPAIPDTTPTSLEDRLARALANTADAQAEAAADEAVTRAGSHTLPLTEWQARTTPDKIVAQRVAQEYPQWLMNLNAGIEVRPQVNPDGVSMLNLWLHGRWFQHLTFNRRWDLYAWFANPSPEDIELLQARVSDPTSLRAVPSERIGSNELPPYRFFVRTDADYALLQEITQRQITHSRATQWPPSSGRIALADWQAQAATEVRNPLAHRLIYEYPAWLQSLQVGLILYPSVERRIFVLLPRQQLQQCNFNKNEDLYVRLYELTAEDVALLRVRLSDPTTLQETKYVGPSVSGLPAYRFNVRNEADYALLQEITQRQIAHSRTSQWPPSGEAAAFVVIHGRDDAHQQYGHSYAFGNYASGDYRKLLEAAQATQAGGPPVYLILYRPGPTYAFTAWARVTDIRELPTGAVEQTALDLGGASADQQRLIDAPRREGERRWQLTLNQHEFQPPLDLKGSTSGLVQTVPWLTAGLSSAFSQRSIRLLTTADFRKIITAAQTATGDPVSFTDAAYTVLQTAEGGPLTLEELLPLAVELAGPDAGSAPTRNSFRSALLSDWRFVHLGDNNWKLAETPAEVLEPESGIWRIHFPRERWKEARTAGVIGIGWDVGSTNRSVQAFKRIKVGDRIIAYIQGGTIGGLGQVTRPFYDTRLTPTDGPDLFGGEFAQQIGVAWADVLPEPVSLIEGFRSGNEAALYNRLKNPHTVRPISPDDYQTLLTLLGLAADPFSDDISRLPTAWPRLQEFAAFVQAGDRAGETADALLARAQAASGQFDSTDDADDFVEQLRQLRLLVAGREGTYRPQPYTAGSTPALLRLLALALLVPTTGSDSQYELPARSILPALQTAAPQPSNLFAPTLGRPDARRLLNWYTEAGLITVTDDGWRAADGALDPLPGNDPTTRAYNELLATLQAEHAGTLNLDLDPVSGPLPAVTDLEARLDELGEDLLFDPAVVRRIYRSLRAGHHVILSGPPGTGKTELARRLPSLLWREAEQLISRLGTDLDNPPVVREAITRQGYYALIATATEDWSVRDVVHGIAPQLESEDGKRALTYTVRYGHVTRALLQHYEGSDSGTRVPPQNYTRRDYRDADKRYRGVWLIIDEFNRAPIDAAFGGLLTTLGGSDDAKLTVDTPDGGIAHIPLPPDFRIIGTLNSFDRHFLNQISEAMKRRFDFIDVLPPSPAAAAEEQGIAIRRALGALHRNGYDAIQEDGTPPTYRWGNLLVAEPVREGDGLRYRARANDPARPALDAFWRIFSAIRVFRLLGTAQALAVYQNLFAGVLAEMSWPESLDAALADSLADQLQVLTRDEQRILAAYIEYGSDAAAFTIAVTGVLSTVPEGRRQTLLRTLMEADYRAGGTTSIAPDAAGAAATLPAELVRVLQPGTDLQLPPSSLFRRRLRELIGERGA